MRRHESYLFSVAFSPDGRWLGSGSEDKTVQLWSVEDPEAPPVVLGSHEGVVRSVAFSPDGKRLATGSGDKTLRIWVLDPDMLCRQACKGIDSNPTCEEWQQFFLMSHTAPFAQICRIQKIVAKKRKRNSLRPDHGGMNATE
jgi:WD40 repeat protein